ncbi:MAG: aldehyde dehydrogenase family protein [Spirochaetae bacterium HGW-Spirochaetae-1]|jgi:aldehyde dehydrogenase (NAD+)|nr:MAG: aldehyde dehydrogenase family protein [Spirochaetae bacterium HGW-Spirochaetae-1]
MNTAIKTEQWNVAETLDSQRSFFLTQRTKDVKFRIENLKKLKKAILKYEDDLFEALKMDLNKAKFEAFATEVGFVLEEISHHIKHLKKWMKPVKVRTDLVNFGSRSYVLHEPFGVVLIMSPWNYPFQLLMDPLVGAISAGNCAVLKPANYSRHVTDVIVRMIGETFDREYISVFTGGRDAIQEILEHRFDYIFFTGSPFLGKIVMEKAARHLTPVSLELGGKSPCIVEDDANLDVAARRIVFGKFLNSGQTCIAPDYLLVNAKVKSRLIEKLKHYITLSYGTDPHVSPDYGRIINDAQFKKLSELLKTGEVIFGGDVDVRDRYMAPTLMDNVKPGDPIMQEEIFGPIFPIMEYDDLDEVVSYINSGEKPLAFYFFTSSRKKEKLVLSQTSSGGGCINDTMVHLTNPRMPFGGVGNSGMGAYHGKYSFDTFSHHRSILAKTTLFDIPLRYAPYGDKLKYAKMVFK